MSTPGSERRRDPRADATLQVQMTGGEGGESRKGATSVKSLNVGAGGVYIEVPHFIEPLTKLSLAMMIPGPTPTEEPMFLETEAIVVRTLPESPSEDVTKYEVACAFLDLSDEHRDAINRYILTHGTAGAPSTGAPSTGS